MYDVCNCFTVKVFVSNFKVEKVKTWTTLSTFFLRFFGHDTSKNVKSRVFWIFKKKRKKRILELCLALSCLVSFTLAFECLCSLCDCPGLQWLLQCCFLCCVLFSVFTNMINWEWYWDLSSCLWNHKSDAAQNSLMNGRQLTIIDPSGKTGATTRQSL